MTTYPQPPIITANHTAALRTVISLWPYPRQVDPQLLHDIAAHLDSLLTAPVPTRHTPILDDWTLIYTNLDAETYQSDQ